MYIFRTEHMGVRVSTLPKELTHGLTTASLLPNGNYINVLKYKKNKQKQPKPEKPILQVGRIAWGKVIKHTFF